MRQPIPDDFFTESVTWPPLAIIGMTRPPRDPDEDEDEDEEDEEEEERSDEPPVVREPDED